MNGFEHWTPSPQAAKSRKIALRTIEEIAQRQPAPWLVKGLLPRQGVAAIYGPSGSGKTFLALDMLGAIIRGDDWFGYRTTQAPVIYIALEGVHGLCLRVRAHMTTIGNLADMRLIEEPYRLINLEDEAALLDAIKAAEMHGAVVVFDTLTQATAGLDENSGEDMTRAIAACQRIQAEINGLVILVHHTGKDAQRGLRGHSSLIGALDAAIEVIGGKDAPRQWTAAKVKDGESGVSHPFELKRIVLDHDEDGDEISSCVIAPTDQPIKPERAKVPSGGNQRIVWDGLGELFRLSGSFPPDGAPKELPPGRPCIHVEEAIEKIRDRLVCEQKRKTERTRQAITGMIASGLLVCRNGFIWCA